MEILIYGNEKLSKKSIIVDIDDDLNIDLEDKKLANNLISFIKDINNSAIGLAAPQVGVNKRMFAALINNEYQVFINPEIISTSKKTDVSLEGCLSIPNNIKELKKYRVIRQGDIKIEIPVRRPRHIKVKSFIYDVENDKLEESTFELKKFNARVFQHEYEHLEGILISDKIKK